MDKATKVCGGCKDISYCSSECQQADWHVHKLLCKSFKDFAQPAPSANMRRVVVFLPGEKKPRFMWAPIRRIVGGPDDHRDGEILRDLEEFEKSSVIDVEHVMRPTYTTKNAWTGQPLGYAIEVLYDDNFKAHYPDRNQAVASAPLGMDVVGWRGPIVAYCGTLGEENFNKFDVVKFHDMDTRACSHLVAFLISHYNRTLEQEMRKGPKVRCVKVACKGDLEKGLPSHQVVSVPRSHPIFNGGGASSEISKVSSHSRGGVSGVCSSSNANAKLLACFHAIAHLEVSLLSALIREPAHHLHAHRLQPGHQVKRRAQSRKLRFRPDDVPGRRRHPACRQRRH